jgi:hypothetical protein
MLMPGARTYTYFNERLVYRTCLALAKIMGKSESGTQKGMEANMKDERLNRSDYPSRQ